MSEATKSRWIEEIANNRTFVDIGGLGFRAANEMISVALEAGASEATMMDIVPLDNPLWNDLDQRCRQKGILRYQRIFGDVNTPGDTGPFDVVHFSGVLYHVPDPVHTMLQVRRLCKRHLILSSMIVPSAIKGPGEDIVLGADRAVFVPAITEQAKHIYAAHFDALDIKIHGINVPEPFVWFYSDLTPNYGPWWWLFTEGYIETLLKLVGFTVLRKEETWAARAVSFLAALEDD